MCKAYTPLPEVHSSPPSLPPPVMPTPGLPMPMPYWQGSVDLILWIWLYVNAYIYIGCIGRSIGYREFILSVILFGRKWTVCEAKRLRKPASKRRLSELWTFYSASDPGTDSYSTSGRRAKTASRQCPTGHRLCPVPSSIMAAPASEDFTPPPGTRDRSSVETGEWRDMYTLTFFNRL